MRVNCDYEEAERMFELSAGNSHMRVNCDDVKDDAGE